MAAASTPLAPASATVAANRSIHVTEFVSAGEPELARTVSRLVAVEVDRLGYAVITAGDLQAAIGVEGTRQELGCDSQGSSECLAELASALGADIIAYGDVTRLNTQMLVTLNFFDASGSRSLGRESVRVGDLDDLPDALAAAVARMLPSLRAGATAPTVAPSSSVPAPLLAVGGGGVLVAAGAFIAGVSLVTNGDSASSREAKDAAIVVYPWAIAGTVTGAVVATAGTIWGVLE
jgi:hypothetical protein